MQTMLPLIAALYPDKVSTKTLVHYGQMITSGNFSKFDYGSLKDNQKNYESKTPPEYDLSKLSAPIVLAIGLKDQLAPPEVSKTLMHIQRFLKHLTSFFFNRTLRNSLAKFQKAL